MEDLTLVIPAKNESESLPTVLSNLNNFNCKKIIVIDPLDNETFEVTKNFNCKTVMQKNKGYGNALLKELIQCKHLSCAFLMRMDPLIPMS